MRLLCSWSEYNTIKSQGFTESAEGLTVYLRAKVGCDSLVDGA